MSQKPESYNCGADCLHIDLGCPLFIQCKGFSDRLKSELVGLYPGLYLIVSTPSELRGGALVAGPDELIVRYVYRGEVLGFKSIVLERIERPFLLTFLSYPKAVERLNLRKSFRVSCNLPATLFYGKSELVGVLTDLSNGGCRFVSRLESIPDRGSLMPDSIVSSSFSLPGAEGKIIAQCTIRNANISKDRAELGLQFTDMESSKKEEIENYIKQISLFAVD